MSDEIVTSQEQTPRERAKERAVDLAIKSTLAYSAIFKYPVSFYQLSTFLVKAKKHFDYDFFKKSLRKLCKKGKVQTKNEKYFLTGIKPLSWEIRKKNSEELLESNKNVFKTLAQIPWIKLLCVTGSVAAYNADKNDDVDIFIVAEKNRIWITRLFVVLTLKALGKYRAKDNYSGKICPNLYVDETNMQWDYQNRNIYVAHEILMMQPWVNRDNCYFKFMEKNKWAFEFFNNIQMDTAAVAENKAKKKPSQIVDLIEKLAMRYQLDYMKSKQTTEVVKKGLIHFKSNDWSQRILDEYGKTIMELEKAS